MAAARFDKEQFWSHIQTLYSSWTPSESPRLWRGAEGLVLVSGSSALTEVMYSRSQAVFQWLTGWELPDTIMIFTDKKILVVASQKKCTESQN